MFIKYNGCDIEVKVLGYVPAEPGWTAEVEFDSLLCNGQDLMKIVDVVGMAVIGEIEAIVINEIERGGCGG